MPVTRSAESRALSAAVWVGVLCGIILTEDEIVQTTPLPSRAVFQGTTPRESQDQDLIRPHKGVEIPTDLLPMLEKDIDSGHEDKTLPPQQQHLLRKMLLGHNKSLHPTWSPVEAPETPSTLNTYNPTTMTQGATKTKPSLTSLVITTVEMEAEPDTLPPAASSCMINFSDPEGYIDSSDNLPLLDGAFLQCTYTVTVYTGYGVELQVKSVNLSEGEQLSIRGVDKDGTLLVLANQTLLVEGQVIRSPTNTMSVFYRSSPEGSMGTFQLHYQLFHLSCPLPRRPHFGEVSVLDLRPGGTAHFSCHMGYYLQGATVVTCLNASLPAWNHREPSCRALCGGDLSGPSGLILSPNWPEWYGEGEDCSWRIHVGEDKRILLDVQLLNLSDSDMLTILDGDEVTTRILGQYVGGNTPFKLTSSTPDLTITFHSVPAGLVFGKGEGFIINYVEVSRNDSCPDLPEIQNGWKTTSHTALVRGTRITYQCDPGYDLVGRETLICQLDLSWSTQPPFCEKIMYCTDPGHVEHSVRTLSDPKLLVGTTIQYSCNLGYILQGGAILTCYGREPGTPVWTSHLPRCILEESVSCENPGLPDNGYQILSKQLYLPGESLNFMCYQGYELIGEITIKCILGNPSFWSGPLPMCRANHECSGNHALEVAEATSESSLDWGNMALAIFILVLLLSVFFGGTYIYVRRCHSNLRLPLMYPHPYRQITVETEFDNPLYETGGDTREYEVSI
ncbi:seizure 6-like protein isoform X3 [Pangasianodon hypophthalmus]|uniref:seizure 6-like protein isoform X3 n=1 Tax=Pangasianodon hypophthalmus TaxID=310915 RepID=UPI0014817556|nr:seizure 6-like protein isoform X3 [Pangasianodon hypophthalmus]